MILTQNEAKLLNLTKSQTCRSCKSDYGEVPLSPCENYQHKKFYVLLRRN